MKNKVLILVLCIAVLLTSCAFPFIESNYSSGEITEKEPGANAYEKNEIYVIAKEDASEEDIHSLAKKYNAKAVNDLKDVGIYLFILRENVPYEDFCSTIQKLNNESLIEKADFNYRFEIGHD